MKSVRIMALGEALRLQDVPTPEPGAGDVLVRVGAAGICHSDAHYRAGTGSLGYLPITPGHEVAGTVEAVGRGVAKERIGERVCLHYLRSCGQCEHCRRGAGQFCDDVKMIGKDVDGGYAEYVVVPSNCAHRLPASIPFEQGAVMMCSFATSLHALRKAKFATGDTLAVFGAGGLGSAAIAIATALGASAIYAVDISEDKVRSAERLGAVAVNATTSDVVETILGHTRGRGVDVALELVGAPLAAQQALRVLAVQGRLAVVGLASAPTEFHTYRELIAGEREIIGVSDHLPGEIDELLALVDAGKLDVSSSVSRTIGLDEQAINSVFSDLDRNQGSAIRTVITFA